jgi:protein-L-isoaspartate(D-aspartate) O-methyltransferase
MQTYQELIDYLIQVGRLKTDSIISAFRKMDRKLFCLPEDEIHAYLDGPLSIGYSQTISQPSTVAIMLEELQVEKGMSVLDIGSGSGWTTALLSEIVGCEGKVVGLERIVELVAYGQHNLGLFGFDHSHIFKAGSVLGRSDEVFDRILVSAAATSFPVALRDQLQVGGRLVIPINRAIHVFEGHKEGIEERVLDGFSFVPLIE